MKLFRQNLKLATWLLSSCLFLKVESSFLGLGFYGPCWSKASPIWHWWKRHEAGKVQLVRASGLSLPGYHCICSLFTPNCWTPWATPTWCHTSVLRSPIRKFFASAFSVLSPDPLTASSWLWRPDHSVTQSTPEHLINFCSGWWTVWCKQRALQSHCPATEPYLSRLGVVRTWGHCSEPQFTHVQNENESNFMWLIWGLMKNLFQSVEWCLAYCS